MRALHAMALFIGLITLTAAECTGDLAGKADSDPVLNIGEISCNKSDIEMTSEVTGGMVSGPPDTQWRIDVKVHIECDGDPVEGARVLVVYFWGEVEEKMTDSDGNVEFFDFTTVNLENESKSVEVVVIDNDVEADSDGDGDVEGDDVEDIDEDKKKATTEEVEVQ